MLTRNGGISHGSHPSILKQLPLLHVMEYPEENNTTAEEGCKQAHMITVVEQMLRPKVVAMHFRL